MPTKSMQFWGLEVKAGQSVKVEPRDEMILHVSQACLGEQKKDKSSEPVYLYASKEGSKFLLGSLSADRFPHLSFDLVFEDEFELSHNWKNGSVHFAGYRSIAPVDYPEDDDEYSSDEELDEELPLNNLDNGAALKAKPANEANTVAGKLKVKTEPIKTEGRNEDEDESDDDDSDEDLDESSSEGEEEDDEDSDEDDEVDEDTPKKPEVGKKRPAEAAAKTPASDKKAKMATPQKTDAKKAGGHVATPHPSKQVGKSTADKSKQQTPKSGGAFTCGSCSKNFSSEQGMQSHSKAKHGK